MKTKAEVSRLLALAAGASIILFATASGYAQALPTVGSAPGGPAYLPGELLVQFKANVTDQQIAGAFQQAGLALIEHLRTPAMKDHGQIGLTHAATAMPVEAAVRLLNNLPGVEFAEPNWVVTPDEVSNDPFYTDGWLWGMYGDDLPFPIGPAGTSNSYGAQAEKAWALGFTGSRDVCVGVIDGGIQLDHPDLAANIWTNPGEIPGNGIDDDGNGYVDDVHGWNAIGNNGMVSYEDVVADTHGTHVAGTIGAVGGNGIGVAGVNWNVTLISGKIFGTNSGTSIGVVGAVDYMTTLKTRKGLNLVALNNSWYSSGGGQALLDAFGRAAQAGIISVVAAGNFTNNNDVSPLYPSSFDTAATAGYDAMVSVAAITRDGNRATYSNYGQTNVDLGAPGGQNLSATHIPELEILSTVPPSTYDFKRGTSMAAPHVTGAAALYASVHPGSTPQQTRYDLLTAGVRPLAALQGITVTGGTLDIGTLMEVPANGLPAPVTPANVQAVVSTGGRVDLNWTDQSVNELGFALERSTDNWQTYVLVDTVGANRTSYSDWTVSPNTTYSYRIRAYNPGGSSGYPNSVTATTSNLGLPAAPTSLTASAQAPGQRRGRRAGLDRQVQQRRRFSD